MIKYTMITVPVLINIKCYLYHIKHRIKRAEKAMNNHKKAIHVKMNGSRFTERKISHIKKGSTMLVT